MIDTGGLPCLLICVWSSPLDLHLLQDLPSEGIDHSFHIMSKRQQERRKGELHIRVHLIAEQKVGGRF